MLPRKWIKHLTNAPPSIKTIQYRNLIQVVLVLQLDASQYVPVMYKEEVDRSKVLGMLPTLVLIGFLLFRLVAKELILNEALHAP